MQQRQRPMPDESTTATAVVKNRRIFVAFVVGSAITSELLSDGYMGPPQCLPGACLFPIVVQGCPPVFCTSFYVATEGRGTLSSLGSSRVQNWSRLTSFETIGHRARC